MILASGCDSRWRDATVSTGCQTCQVTVDQPDAVLDRFSPATRAWFDASFASPTPAQLGAWTAISGGEHTLVVAPTGSGKTLAAFLWAIDRMLTEPRAASEQLPRCRIIYVSPLKALAVDVERNLRSPLVGIGHAAVRLGLPTPPIGVAVRSGDTPANERREFARAGAEILITTPESLFLLLTSQARTALAGVESVIIDEVHAVAGTKRGAHLALSLERLDALLPRPAQRIGLSATVRPVDEVARFLAGGRPVSIVQPQADKRWELEVQVPVPDMSEPGAIGTPPAPQRADDDFEIGVGPVLPVLPEVIDPVTGKVTSPGPTWQPPAPASDPTERASMWPHIERATVDLIEQQHSTLVFTNSRRVAERFTARLNEQWDARHDASDQGSEASGVRPPAQLAGQSGNSQGAPPVLARAHHGSVAKQHRAEIEDALKRGVLPAVVATSSLELGIDMGAVDLVVQIASPPSVASGLQRVGRAGHQVGAVSHGVIFPTHRGDLVAAAVITERMRAGLIEALQVPANPLDVLAQQLVAMAAMDDWQTADAFDLVRRAASFTALPRSVFDAVLDMLAGRYPGEEFADLRPRLVWDRITDTISARRGSQLLAITSGGTIPDRGLYAVMLATGDGPGRRVGELDEEMVYESRVGDVFTLGTTSWRIEDITPDQVLVTPAPGQIGRLPFWHGEAQGRPAELGAAVGAFTRQTAGLDPPAALAQLGGAGLDAWAAENLVNYLTEQREATGRLPDDRTILVERFRDEVGDWRVVVHSPWGNPVHAPWALCLAARLRERYGADVQAMAADDGIVLRLPDLSGWADADGPAAGSIASRLDAEIAELLTIDPDEVADLVTEQIGGSALFAARFRECAARALLLPRMRPGRRQPLWQQRQRSAQLLEVAARYPSFPIVLEAVRECVQDVYDVAALTELMRGLASRQVQIATVATASASPFARTLLMGYVAQFLYEGDSPLAERRAAALRLDPTLLAELLGRGNGAALRDLLDPEVVARTEAELQRLTPERAARDRQDVLDLPRALGPLSAAELAERCDPSVRGELPGWLAELAETRALIEVRVAGEQRWAAVEDAARLRDALGVALPIGVPAVFLEPVDDPLGDLLLRHARTHGPFTAAAVAARLGLGVAVVKGAALRLVESGRLVSGALLPDGVGDDDLCDAEVLRLLRRRTLAALRQEVEPVTQTAYARFLPKWQSVGELRGVDGLLRAVEQLAGARLPASAVESLILPARVRDYQPAMLDELTGSGEVIWQGHGALPGDDGWISLHLAETAQLTLAAPEGVATGAQAAALVELLGRVPGAAYLFRPLSDALGASDDQELLNTLWELVWAGLVSADGFAPVRGLLAGGRSAHKPRRAPLRSGRLSAQQARLAARVPRPGLPNRFGPPGSAGRWALLPRVEDDPTVRGLASADQLLDRYGVLTRGSVFAEQVPGGFAAVYRVLAGAEEAGRVRRGYLVEGLGAAQFGTAGAIDRLRALDAATSQPGRAPDVVLLAATDPANPYGASISWPELGAADQAHRPARKAGAMVLLADGWLVAYLERGGGSVLTAELPAELVAGQVWAAAAQRLAAAVQAGTLGGLTIVRIDGEPALGATGEFAQALLAAGFHLVPQGLRLRR